MNISTEVRRSYELRPYPVVGKRIWNQPRWRLPPPKWIEAMWQRVRVPERILVAGCGTGMEAFAIARRFKHSEVVGVDFSPRSIAIARHLQKRQAGLRHVRFVVGDITTRHLVNTVGNDFDLISCHGVLSYIPQTRRAFDNFARCLTPHGALYLGVNGVRHFSATWRPALAKLGFQLAEFEDGKELRQALRLCEALDSHNAPRIANRGAEYLAGDLFGPLIHNWPLARWMSLAQSAGLHFLGSYYAHRALRPIFKDDLYRQLLPRSRAETHMFVELLSPSGFHSLLFVTQPRPNPPWQNASALLRWRARSTDLYTCRWPKRRRLWRKLRRVQLKSVSTNTVVDLSVPEWELEILRQADGKQTLEQLLAGLGKRVPANVVRDRVYSHYLLVSVNRVSAD